MSHDDWVHGRVMRFRSGFYDIQTDTDTVTCVLRGRLKRRTIQGDVISVGDEVSILRLSDGTGAVEEIHPRHSALVRLDPTPRGVFQQILLANPDQVLLVFSCANPAPHLRMLDRFLVICEKAGIPPLIIANKVDLVGLEVAQQIFSIYPPLGYRVIFTSKVSGLGLEELRAALTGRISGLAGPSGVGKSSLLNAIQPELGLAVCQVSDVTRRGMHTTVVRQMFALNEGGYVADLPGLRSLALWDTEPEELDGYFPELRHLVQDCQYNDCTHQAFELGCAVQKAVEEGSVHPERYESYLRMRFGERSISVDEGLDPYG